MSRRPPFAEIALAALRCGEAVGLFAVQEAARLQSGGDPRRRVERAITEVDHAAERQLGDTLGHVYRHGRYFAEGFFDTALEIARGGWLRDGEKTSPAWLDLDRPWSTLAGPPPQRRPPRK